MRELKFHSDFQSVTLVVDGVPMTVNAEVDVIIRQPAKLDGMSRSVWKRAAGAKDRGVSTAYTPELEA